jgi:hypothetical protein
MAKCRDKTKKSESRMESQPLERTKPFVTRRSSHVKNHDSKAERNFEAKHSHHFTETSKHTLHGAIHCENLNFENASKPDPDRNISSSSFVYSLSQGHYLSFWLFAQPPDIGQTWWRPYRYPISSQQIQSCLKSQSEPIGLRSLVRVGFLCGGEISLMMKGSTSVNVWSPRQHRGYPNQ